MIFGNVHKNTKKSEKRYEKALRDHQYTLHLEADPGDHSGLLRSPPWDYQVFIISGVVLWLYQPMLHYQQAVIIFW